MCREETIKSCKCAQCSCEGQSIIYHCPLFAQSKETDGEGKCPMRRTYIFDADDNIVCHCCENGTHGQYGMIVPETGEFVENWRARPDIMPWDGKQTFQEITFAYPTRRLAPGTGDCPLVAPSGPAQVVYQDRKQPDQVFNPYEAHLSEAGKRKGQVAAETLPDGLKFGVPKERISRPSVAGTTSARERTVSFVTELRGVRLQTPQAQSVRERTASFIAGFQGVRLQTPQAQGFQQQYTQQPAQQRQYAPQPSPAQIQQFLQARQQRFLRLQQQPVYQQPTTAQIQQFLQARQQRFQQWQQQLAQQQQNVQYQYFQQYPQYGVQQPQLVPRAQAQAQAQAAQFAQPPPAQQPQFVQPAQVQQPQFVQLAQVQRRQSVQPSPCQQPRVQRPRFASPVVSPLHVQRSPREDSEPVEKFPDFRPEDFDPNTAELWDFDEEVYQPTQGDAAVHFDEPLEKYSRSNDRRTDDEILKANERDLDELFGSSTKSALGGKTRNGSVRTPQAPASKAPLPKKQPSISSVVGEDGDSDLSSLSSHDSEEGDTIVVAYPPRLIAKLKGRRRPSQRKAQSVHESADEDSPVEAQASTKRHHYAKKASKASAPQRPAKASKPDSESGSESASSGESEEDVPRRGGRQRTRKNTIKKSVGKRELNALRRDSGGKRELESLRRGSKHARSPGPDSPSRGPNKRRSTRVQAQERLNVVKEESEDEDEEMPDAGLHVSSDEDSETEDDYKPAKSQQKKRRRY